MVNKNIRAKCHSMGKRQQETGWKYVTDRQNVTKQVKEDGHLCHKLHDVHLATGVDVKSRDVVNGCHIVTGTKCHSGWNLQWMFCLD
jgi:hypothetical protein